MAIKQAQIEHEPLRRLYLDIGDLADCGPDDPRLPELADRVAAFIEAAAAEAEGVEDEHPVSDELVELLDAAFLESFAVRAHACSSCSRSAAGRAGPTSGAPLRPAEPAAGQVTNTDQQMSLRSRSSSRTSSRMAGGSCSCCHAHSARPAASLSSTGAAARAALMA